MTALLCVQATVDPAVTDAFNRWYEIEHIPDACRMLSGIQRVSRWQSLTTPDQFTTVYQFDSPQQVLDALGSHAMKQLIAEFDKRWSHTVTRERAGHLQIYSVENP